jgi:hypothetical protein
VSSSPTDNREASRRRHAIIAGTGRAGTSFLVRFLEHCGLDTGSRDVPVDPRARAGLEHSLLADDAPYVVKDPWFFAYCDELDENDVGVDVLLVPVRELMAASTSRVLQERIAMAEETQWSTLAASSDVHGAVAGGAVYSLDPVDQARLLAVGFHRLVHWATARRVPLIFLEFPRIVHDGEYLVETLWPWLGARCQRDRALAAFAAVADPGQVRVRGPALADHGVHATDRVLAAADAELLDRTALKALLAERDDALRAALEDLGAVRHQLVAMQGQLAETRTRLASSEHRATETERNLGATLAASQDMLNRESHRLEQTEEALHAATTEMEDMLQTRSWRLTRPLRSIKARGRGGSHGEGATPLPPVTPHVWSPKAELTVVSELDAEQTVASEGAQ